MTIEKQIKDFQTEFIEKFSVHFFKTRGEDLLSSEVIVRRWPNSYFWNMKNGPIKSSRRYGDMFIKHVHEMIQDTPLEICLTSEIQYIREYRMWWEKNNDK